MKTTKSKKILWTIVSFLLVALLACSVLLVQYINKPAQVPEASAPAVDQDGNELESGKVHDMPKGLAFRSATSLANGEYDAVTVKATVKPENATYKEVDWAIAWDQEEIDKQEDIWNSWWQGDEQITDYVTVTPTTDGSTTATVKCLQPFGVPAIITVTSRNNPNAKATCRVDFVKRIVSAEFAFSDVNDDGNNLFSIYGDFAESGTNNIEAEETGLPANDDMPAYMHLNPQGLEWQEDNEEGGQDTIQDYKHIVYTPYTIDDFTAGPVITVRPTQELISYFADECGMTDFNDFFNQVESGSITLPVIESGTQIPLKMESVLFMFTQDFLDIFGGTSDDLCEYFRDYSGGSMPYMEILVTFEGTYNTYTQSLTLIYDSSSHFAEFQIRVTGVEIDNSQVII